MRTTFYRSVFVLLLIMAQYGVSYAQPSNPAVGPPDVPLGGIEILLGAGLAYGARKIYMKRKIR